MGEGEDKAVEGRGGRERERLCAPLPAQPEAAIVSSACHIDRASSALGLIHSRLLKFIEDMMC